MSDITFNPKRSVEEFVDLENKIASDNPVSGPVKKWSFSRLSKYEECPYAVFLRYVKKLKTDIPIHPNAQRGIDIHKAGEDFINGTEGELHEGFRHFRERMHDLRKGFEEAKVTCEEEWGFTVDWDLCAWDHPDIWAQFILDVYVEESPTYAKVIDFKTGKFFGNELKHAQQGLFYVVAAFMRNPELELVDCEFWYLDQNHIMEKSYTRDAAMSFLPRIINRALALTRETDFIAKPSKNHCRWCDYRKANLCEWADPFA